MNENNSKSSIMNNTAFTQLSFDKHFSIVCQFVSGRGLEECLINIVVKLKIDNKRRVGV